MSHKSSRSVPLSDRAARAYAEWTGKRPFLTLGLWLIVVVLCGWYGSGIEIRSQIEDLFPDNTPAVLNAREARKVLKSPSQMLVVFGSVHREANRKLATDFCNEVSQWPEVATVECRRDIEFFRKNAALFLSEKELSDIELDVRKLIKDATEKEIGGDELTAGLDDAPTPTVADATDKPPMQGEKRRTRVPSEDELKTRLGGGDIREWVESPNGDALGIKIFPTFPPQDMQKGAVFLDKVNATLKRLNEQKYAPDMVHSITGDYSELRQEINQIQYNLVYTSLVALLVIALIQISHFRRVRSLILMSIPMLAGTALTLAFARGAVGYMNMVTAFIFSMLFGMGNDFNVYTLSRYLEERAAGHPPEEAVARTMAGLWGALGQAMATTSVAFFALVVLEFRGFSQFGLIAGVGVALSLFATLGLFGPLTLAMNRMWPDPPPKQEHVEGAKWLGWFAQPRIARLTLYGLGIVTVLALYNANGFDFETDFRKLRTISSTPANVKSAPDVEASSRYHHYADQSSDTPILLVTDSIGDSLAVHKQLQALQGHASRLDKFLSIHTFVPENQAQKQPTIERIRTLIEAKMELLKGDDKIEAERALKWLHSEPYTAAQLPDFIRKRFLDQKEQLGRFVLIWANGNLAEAKSVQEVIDQIGEFKVGPRTYHGTASFFILAEADHIVRKEGPWAVILATIATFAVVLWYFRSWWLLTYSFIALTASFIIFLGIARGLGLELNLFSVTTLPGIVGIGIDGVTHILHRWDEEGEHANVQKILQQVGGAAWVALLTTMVGFAALLFQPNRGLQTMAWMATIGLLVSCLVSNVLTGAMLTVFPPKRRK
jgi:preprotein translocase subunit SecF